jgi:hypothetical protein
MIAEARGEALSDQERQYLDYMLNGSDGCAICWTTF